MSGTQQQFRRRSGSGVRRSISRSKSREFIRKQEDLARRKQMWIDEQNDKKMMEIENLR